MKKKLVLYSEFKRNQPDKCRFYKADMDKYVASIVYRGWIISILNENRNGIFVLLYTPSTKQNLG